MYRRQIKNRHYKN